MPGSNEDYSNFLDSQQKTAAEQAAKKGTPIDTRELAMAKVVGQFQSSNEALEYIARAGSEDVYKKSTLEAKRATTSLSPSEETVLAEADARIRAGENLASAAVRHIDDESRERVKVYSGKPFSELAQDVQNLNEELAAKKKALGDAITAGRSPGDQRVLNDQVKGAEFRFSEAKSVYDRKLPEEKRLDEEQRQQDAVQETERRLQELEALPIDMLHERTNAIYDEWNKLNRTPPAVRATRQEKAIYEAQKTALSQMWGEASDALKAKEEVERNRLDKEADDEQRATLSVASLDRRRLAADRSTIDLTSKLRDKDTDIAAARASGADPKSLADLSRERNQLANALAESKKTLKAEEDAIKLARDREGKAAGSTASIETLDRKSWNEYGAMNPEEQARYLEQISERSDLTSLDFDDVKQKIMDPGQKTSFEERAFFASGFADKMINGGVSSKELPRIAARHPDVYRMIADRVVNSNEAKILAEKHGSKLEKLVNWAKKDYKWLMILMLLLGGAAAAIGPVTSLTGAGALLTR